MIIDNNDPYDSLDEPYASYTNHTEDPKTFDDYVEFVKLGNQIKEQLIKQTKYETSTFMLKCLHAVINEQVDARILRKFQGDMIYEFVESMALNKGYLAW